MKNLKLYINLLEDFKKLETPYFTVEKILSNGLYEDKVNNDFHSKFLGLKKGAIIQKKESVKY